LFSEIEGKSVELANAKNYLSYNYYDTDFIIYYLDQQHALKQIIFVIIALKVELDSRLSALRVVSPKESCEVTHRMDHKRKDEVKNKCPPTLRSATLIILIVVGAFAINAVFLLVGDVRINRRLSTVETALEDLKQRTDQVPKMSDASSVELNARKKRSVSSNTSQKQSDFEKRLQALEKR